MIDKTIGHYRIISLLGKGGMASPQHKGSTMHGLHDLGFYSLAYQFFGLRYIVERHGLVVCT